MLQIGVILGVIFVFSAELKKVKPNEMKEEIRIRPNNWTISSVINDWGRNFLKKNF